MIVDYNYKPYVYTLSNGKEPPATSIDYFSPFKNNKGFIFFVGLDDASTTYYPIVTVTTPSGDGITFSPQLETGSFGDMFMQFKRDTTSINTSRSSDICMVRGGNSGGQLYSSFFPTSYQKITITADGIPLGTSWTVAPVIITLY